MTTSGSTNFTRTRDQILKGALRLCGVLGSQETASAEDIQDASDSLNVVAKHLMTEGLQVWLQDEATLFLEKSKQKYSLGPTGDQASSASIKTEVKTAVSSGTTLDVDDTTGMTAADVAGLELDDGTMHWTTIASVTDSDTVELTAAVPSAAAVDNHFYTYTSLITRPYEITEMWHRDESDIDTPMFPLSHNEYVALSDKATSGQSTQYFYDRQLTNGFLHIWPTADNLKDRIFFYFYREVEDFDVAADTPDFPKHYYLPLKWMVAADIGAEHGLTTQRLTYFESKGLRLLKKALDFDQEPGSVFLGVNTRG